MKVKILIADDHTLFREGLRSLLESNCEYSIIGEAVDGQELIRMLETMTEKPDLILMDVQMPNCNGLTATRLIKEKYPQIKIVMLSICEEEEALATAVKHGAEGYLLKNLKKDDLFKYINSLSKGEAPLSPKMTTKMLERVMAEGMRVYGANEVVENFEKITEREHEVWKLVAQGYNNIEIAKKLEVTDNTIKNHLKSIMKKLKVDNRVQLAAILVKQDLLFNNKNSTNES